MTDNKKHLHRAGRPIKDLDESVCDVLLTMYESKSTRQIAQYFNVSQPTICSWLKKARKQRGYEQEETQEKQEKAKRYLL